MLRKMVQLLFFLTGITVGIFVVPTILRFISLDDIAFLNNPYMSAVIGALIFYLCLYWTIDYVIDGILWLENKLLRLPIVDIIIGSIALFFGLLIAFLVGTALSFIDFPIINTAGPIVVTLLFGYLSFQVGLKKRDELLNLVSKKKKAVESPKETDTREYKILDTSVIIDGRIADILQTGFLEGTIVIPQFVLAELQYIADSSDVLKRNRGRRGLDILNRIQKEMKINVEIFEGDFEEIHEVDLKLIRLAKQMTGIVVTNDYNLNKVCEFQSIPVLNINDLANAVKQIILPGEEMHVLVVKEGKEHSQGLAYLDDGTMIVVENGKEHTGSSIDVVVTSVLQTSAGRMIFAKPKILL